MPVFLSPLGGAGAQFFDNNGVILSGGKIYTYAAGTTTPQVTYTSSSGAVPHANPIILDSAGRVPGGEIWLTYAQVYKFVIETSTGVLLGTYDNISGINAAQINADIVVYDPPFTGAVSTNVEAKLAQYVSVKDFGAVGDGVTNDTAAIQAAFNNSSALFFPKGTYVLTAKITATKATAFSFYGDGMGNTILFWDTATGGIEITSTNIIAPITVDGLTFYTNRSGGGTALKVTYPVAATSLFVGSRYSNLELRGSDFNTDYWTEGLRLVNHWNLQCTGLHIQGSDTYTRGMTKAISMTDCYDPIITSVYGARGLYGIWVSDGEDEGMNVSDCVFIDFETGIYFNSVTAQAGTAISNNHMNTEKFGIDFQAKQQCLISGNLIYKITGSTMSYVGISLKFCNDSRITENYVRNTGTSGGEIGVLLDDTDNCIVTANQFTEFSPGSVGVQVATASGGNYISNNSTYTVGTTIVNFTAAALKTNICSNNSPVPRSTLEANSATPSVGNDRTGRWATGNTVATTITTFSDPYDGQVILLVANDNNTTLQNSASLNLKGGVNYVMVAGNVITLWYDGGSWRETSRNN